MPPTPKFRPTLPTPKFYGPTPSTPEFQPMPTTSPTPKFYGPTLPTPPTPKFDPRHPCTRATTLPTPPTNQRHPRDLADFQCCVDTVQQKERYLTSLFVTNIYLFKVNNRNTTKRCKRCSQLKTPQLCQCLLVGGNRKTVVYKRSFEKLL